MTRKYLLAPLALALLLSACGGGDDDAEPAATSSPAPAATAAGGSASGSAETTTVNTDEGELTVGGEGAVPEGFPERLLYPGGAIVSSITVDEDRTVLIFSTPDSIDDILDYYEDAFDAVGLGDDGQRVAADDFGSYAVGDGDNGSGVLIQAGGADNGDNLVTLGYLAS